MRARLLIIKREKRLEHLLLFSETHSSRRNFEKRILRDWDHWVDVLYCKRVGTFLVSTGLKPESHTGE